MKKIGLKKLDLIQKQIQKVDKRENKILSKKDNQFLKDKFTPIQEKIESKIPPKLQQTLEKAFESGFRVVFKKGVGLIEKSYKKEEKSLDFDIKHYAVLKQTNNKNLRNLDKTAKKSILGNQLISTVEGSVLGALGIGLPDIPILIGMILKNLYEVSLSYGFDYTTDKEKLYILYLICAGVTKDQAQEVYNEKLNSITRGAIEEVDLESSVEKAIKEASHCLAEAMLVAKFIQGLPIVGIVGGICNFNIMKDISQMAQVKYKKRYLEQLLNDN